MDPLTIYNIHIYTYVNNCLCEDIWWFIFFWFKITIRFTKFTNYKGLSVILRWCGPNKFFNPLIVIVLIQNLINNLICLSKFFRQIESSGCGYFWSSTGTCHIIIYCLWALIHKMFINIHPRWSLPTLLVQNFLLRNYILIIPKEHLPLYIIVYRLKKKN